VGAGWHRRRSRRCDHPQGAGRVQQLRRMQHCGAGLWGARRPAVTATPPWPAVTALLTPTRDGGLRFASSSNFLCAARWAHHLDLPHLRSDGVPTAAQDTVHMHLGVVVSSRQIPSHTLRGLRRVRW